MKTRNAEANLFMSFKSSIRLQHIITTRVSVKITQS